MNKYVLFLFLLITKIKSCEIGCLKCNKDNQCIFCDISKNYILKEKTCTKSTSENCEILNYEGNCYKCKTGAVLDNVTKKCILVTSSIDNCEIYSNSSTCETCKRNYFVNGTNCELINENLINNCSYYATKIECKECQNGYILSFDKKSCEESPAQTNCAFYSRAFCKNCTDGYILNYQLFAEKIFKFDTESDKKSLADFFNAIIYGREMTKMVNVCKKIEVENCEIVDDATKCNTCKSGYYKTSDNKCQAFKKAGIKNCYIYQKIDACKECTSEHFLQSPTSCVPVQIINQCVKYDGKSNSTKCVECNAGFFSNLTTCNERVNSKSILNCKTLDLLSDQCFQCEDNFVLSTNGLKCFSKILNCETYASSSSNDIQIKCNKCLSGYFLFDSQTCNPGQITNCDIYGNQANICKQCNNTYYLSNNTCVSHDRLINCESYSNTDNKTCLQCDPNYYNFKIIQFCKFEVPINNCKEYEERSPLKCKECELGYYLSNNQCLIIPVSSCSKYNGSKCTECETDYALDQTDIVNVKCSPLFTYLSSNCAFNSLQEPSNSQTITTAYCMECQDFAYPVGHKEHFVCERDDNLEKMGVKQDKVVLGCIKYNIQKECVQCETGKFLENNKCVTNCSTGSYKLNKFIKTGTTTTLMIEFVGYNECAPSNTLNIEIFALDLSLSSETILDVPVKCKANTLPIYYITNDKRYTNMDYSKAPEDYIANLIIKVPAISVCEPITANAAVIANCDYYTYVVISSTVSKVKCLKCKHGHNSVISKEGTTTISYYMNSCLRDNNITLDYYFGLDIEWIKLFSAHKCVDSKKIPFIAIDHVSITNPSVAGIKEFGLTQLNHITSPVASAKFVDCIEDKPESFGYTTTDANQMAKYQKLPDNCGLGIINLKITDGTATGNRTVSTSTSNPPSISGLAQYCGACLPGYKDTIIHPNFPQIKVKCDMIENCVGKNWFNNCSECANNYVFLYENDSINFKGCILNSVQNCLSASEKTKCNVCKKGYILNKDYICETYSPPNCKSNLNFNLKQKFQLKNIALGNYLNSLGTGCNQCMTGYKAVELDNSASSSFVCTSSTYIQQNYQNFPDTTSYIKFCINYGVIEERVICRKCISNYVLNLDKSKCYYGPSNCEISDGPQKCLQCLEGYPIENYLCVLGQIAFCKKYNLKNNVSKPRCEQCDKNYFLNSNYECELGEITNCEIFANFNGKKCIKCLNGYGKYSDGVSDYCFKIKESLNCKEAIIRNNLIYGAELECKVCNNANELLNNLSAEIKEKTICMEISKIENCKEYQSEGTITESNFKCLLCEDGYYLSTSINCSKRTILDSFCELYSINQDKCEECNPEYFLTNTGTCEIKPNGIKSCSKYKEEKTCIECTDNSYLENNNCISVANENLITSCVVYADSQTCAKCDNNSILKDSKCITAKAKNCLTYVSENACASCKQNYGLKKTNDIVDCVIVNKIGCADFDQEKENYPCKSCLKNYYLNGDNCSEVSVKINNCDYYSNIEMCSQCKYGFALKNDGKSCIALSLISADYDRNCSDYRDNITCSVCRPGSYFLDTNCVDCKDSKGCFYCDTKDSNLCLLCQSEYHMDNLFKCIPDVIIPPPIPLFENILHLFTLFLFLV